MSKAETDEELAVKMENYQDIKSYWNHGIDKHTPLWRVEHLQYRMEQWLEDVCTHEHPTIPDEAITKMLQYKKECESAIKGAKKQDDTQIQRQFMIDIIEQHFMPRTLTDEEFKIGMCYLISGLMRRRTPEGETCSYELHETATRTTDDILETIRARRDALNDKQTAK